ncbi:MAG: Carbon monoxide dehydrogenase small chain [Syntrophorhabdaceae bacterium PtaU1.Bin034]|jgi:carbon-monoxide dehydrogenase small subunit|nr:MAG: Carbon monoxide dehydrogenase small chain [Syntrophorhabdaceae bacterium PtaU1.Bin034]
MDSTKKAINVKINGEAYEVAIKPRTTLLQLLRNELRLTGTKQACMDNSCGACTVIVDKMAVKACSVLAMQVNGREVTSVEGLASKDGTLSPLQQAFLEHNAFQCGFCTPGKLMSSTAMLEEMPDPTEEDIRRDMEGNLCRCTGYVQYIETIMDVVRKRKEGKK